MNELYKYTPRDGNSDFNFKSVSHAKQSNKVRKSKFYVQGMLGKHFIKLIIQMFWKTSYFFVLLTIKNVLAMLR